MRARVDDTRRWWRFATGLIVVLAGFVFVKRRGQDVNFDLLNYHFYAGYSALHGRFDVDVAPAGLATFLSPHANALSFAALSLPFPWSTFAITAIQLSVVPIVLLLAKMTCRGDRTATYVSTTAAALLGLLSPTWLGELGTTFSSSSTAVPVLGALAATIHAMDTGASSRRRRSYLCAAGALSALAMGLKLTNAPFLVAVFTIIAVDSLGRQPRFQVIENLGAASLGAIVGIAPIVPWYARLAFRYGNPVFPMFNGLFRSPYFAPTNWRDDRWRFDSLSDLARFIVTSARGSSKTGEVAFTDARFLCLAILTAIASLVLIAVRVSNASRLDGNETLAPKSDASRTASGASAGRAMVVFLVVSGAIWAKVFAYQRYFIPAELVVGFGILAAVRMIARDEHRVAFVMTGVTILCAALVVVPDWGHTRFRGKRAAHWLRPALPAALASEPADYLMYDVLNSFMIPSFDRRSRFVRGDFDPGFDPFVRQALRRNRNRRLRIFAPERAFDSYLGDALKRSRAARRGDVVGQCWRIAAVGEPQLVCDVIEQPSTVSNAANLVVRLGIDDQSPPWIENVVGLDVPEGSARWSITDEVAIRVRGCLDGGNYRVELVGKALGPNVDRDINVRIGTGLGSVRLQTSRSIGAAEIAVPDTCASEIVISVPEKVTPESLGINDDRRTLGLFLESIAIRRRP